MTLQESIIKSCEEVLSIPNVDSKVKELACMIVNDPEYLLAMLRLINGICISSPEIGAAFMLQMLHNL